MNLYQVHPVLQTGPIPPEFIQDLLQAEIANVALAVTVIVVICLLFFTYIFLRMLASRDKDGQRMDKMIENFAGQKDAVRDLDRSIESQNTLLTDILKIQKESNASMMALVTATNRRSAQNDAILIELVSHRRESRDLATIVTMALERGFTLQGEALQGLIRIFSIVRDRLEDSVDGDDVEFRKKLGNAILKLESMKFSPDTVLPLFKDGDTEPVLAIPIPPDMEDENGTNPDL